MTKQFWIILAVIAAVFVGIVVYSNNKKSDNGSSNTTSTAAVTHHVEGKGTTGVKLQEYGDYQCPICGDFYQAVKQVVAKYNDQITFQFSNLPLTQLHPNTMAASRAAEAAGLQGKYWEMHDLLYTNQNAWAGSSNAQAIFEGYAQQLGLNMTQFKKDYSSQKVNNAINADVAAFKKTGDPEATPTFYLDGKKLDNTSLMDSNGPSVAKFSKVIDAEIAKKTQDK
ncbi:MAG TPA: thioredoxin domain-containing protein [Candidatus Saccharimonadales bacterium]|nr:thioredoxin domain-containing protein [Candidatus Saccharimonadales bacterium]